jgi:hypothetical protein
MSKPRWMDGRYTTADVSDGLLETGAKFIQIKRHGTLRFFIVHESFEADYHEQIEYDGKTWGLFTVPSDNTNANGFKHPDNANAVFNNAQIAEINDIVEMLIADEIADEDLNMLVNTGAGGRQTDESKPNKSLNSVIKGLLENPPKFDRENQHDTHKKFEKYFEALDPEGHSIAPAILKFWLEQKTGLPDTVVKGENVADIIGAILKYIKPDEIDMLFKFLDDLFDLKPLRNTETRDWVANYEKIVEQLATRGFKASDKAIAVLALWKAKLPKGELTTVLGLLAQEKEISWSSTKHALLSVCKPSAASAAAFYARGEKAGGEKELCKHCRKGYHQPENCWVKFPEKKKEFNERNKKRRS